MNRIPFSPQHCLIIGEIGQAHDGSLGMAHAYIDAVAKAGADAVKFQTHLAAAESSPAEPWRVLFSPQDDTRFEYWKRMEFTPEQWHGLKNHADECGLLFLSSPFSLEAVELLERVGVSAWKIPSGEINNLPLLEKTAAGDLPVILSSGMSPLEELDRAVQIVQAGGSLAAILQCTTAYPCPPEKIGLNVISVLRERYNNCAVGLSDHSGTIYPGLAAAALGIEILEVHVTMNREMFGPDVPASVTTEELARLVAGIRFIEKMKANPLDKDRLAVEMEPQRRMFTKSIVARRDLLAGTVLEEKHLALKKPGTGLPPEKLEKLLGRKLTKPLKADEIIREEDLEG